FYAMAVDSTGITSLNDYVGAFTTNEKLIHFDRGTGLIYSDNGQVIDPSTGNTIGQFPDIEDSPLFGMVPDSTINRAFFLIDGISSFNLTDLSLINSIDLPSTGVQVGVPNRLIRW